MKFLILVLTFFLLTSTLHSESINPFRPDMDDVFSIFIHQEQPDLPRWKVNSIIRNVKRYSFYYGISPTRVLAHMKVESSFNNRAVSMRNGKKISYGLMQIYPKVWLSKKNDQNLIKEGILKNKGDLFNIELNIKSGVYVMSRIRSICSIYKRRGSLVKKGYTSTFSCEIKRYNGSIKPEYYEKVLKAIGEIYLLSRV